MILSIALVKIECFQQLLPISMASNHSYMVVFTSKTYPLHLTSCSNIFGDLIYKSSEKLISILSDMMEIFNSIEFQCYNIHLPMEQAINRIIACDTSTFKRNDAYAVLCIRTALQQ